MTAATSASQQAVLATGTAPLAAMASRPCPLASLAAAELPAALTAALRRFGPSWRRWVGTHLGEGLSHARLQMLGQLAAGEGPLMMRELTAASGVTPRAVTALVDGLEAEGFVRRQPHPHDRRVTLVLLTDAGRDVQRRQGTGGLAAAGSLFAVLSEQDQRALLRIMSRLTAALGEAAGPLGPCDPPGAVRPG